MSTELGNSRIRLHLDVHEPIELVELTLSFQAIAREYRAFLVGKSRSEGRSAKDTNIKLYVTKIESNCILAELGGATEIMGALFQTMDYTNIFIEFVKNIDQAINYFKQVGKSGKIPTNLPYSKRQTNSIADIVKTVSKNKDSRLRLSAIECEVDHENETEHLKVEFTSEDATNARRGALLVSQALEQRDDVDYPNVLMFMHQANIDPPKDQGRTGYRAIIKSISDNDLPVHFVSDLDKDRISDLVQDPDLNPFKASYRVDVNVEVDRNDKPKFYRVAKLHEIIPDDEP
jgi:hypothetical protein